MKLPRYYCLKCCCPVAQPEDHRKPRSQGGSDDPGNIQPLCPAHHRWKHENPDAAHAEGLLLRRGEAEVPWWIDFPHGVCPLPIISI